MKLTTLFLSLMLAFGANAQTTSTDPMPVTGKSSTSDKAVTEGSTSEGESTRPVDKSSTVDGMMSTTNAPGMTATTPLPAETAGLKAQVLLDRAHFSVGEIDGNLGSTSKAAVRHFQEARGLSVTGELDQATLSALDDGQPILKKYTLTDADVSGPFGAKPKYANMMEKLGEKFQSSPNLLKKLNPGAKFAAGESIVIPAVGEPLGKGSIASIQVSTSKKALTVHDSSGKMIAYYPTTLGSEESIPYGDHKVVSATRNPYYRRVLPGGKVRAMNGGPNNYVGNMWMALTQKHYGIHGSPEPSKIAKQESAGCIRLTNWDANEVAGAITKNTKVTVQK